MPIDLEAIRKKVQQLETGRQTSRTQFWKADPGKHKVRVVPWPSHMVKDGQPFVELFFYYIGDKSILCPFQFGKEDPIADLRKKLYDSGNPDDREVAKKLKPKMRSYALVVDREKESEGVKVWSFGKTVYMRLLGFFLEDDCEDWMDPIKGIDLLVTISKIEGKRFNDTHVDMGRKSSRLAASDDDVKSLLDAAPSVTEMYREKSTEEIQKILDDWLRDEGGSDSDGESRNESEDALDQMVNEIQDSAKPEKKKSSSSKKKEKSTELDELDDANSKPSIDLEAAFAEFDQDEEG